jgi:hypothetical protein
LKGEVYHSTIPHIGQRGLTEGRLIGKAKVSCAPEGRYPNEVRVRPTNPKLSTRDLPSLDGKVSISGRRFGRVAFLVASVDLGVGKVPPTLGLAQPLPPVVGIEYGALTAQ